MNQFSKKVQNHHALVISCSQSATKIYIVLNVTFAIRFLPVHDGGYSVSNGKGSDFRIFRGFPANMANIEANTEIAEVQDEGVRTFLKFTFTDKEAQNLEV